MSKPSRSGFTLFELLLALGLVAVLTAIVVPPLWQGMQSRRLADESVSIVMNGLREARRKAIVDGVPCLYWLESDSNLQSIQLVDGSRPVQSWRLAPSIRLEVEPANRSKSIVFQPDGSCNGFEVRLSGAITTRTIQVDHLTGLPRLGTMGASKP